MIKKLRPKSDFSRNVLTLMTGTIVAQAIPIALSPILTRIYSPQEFGEFALYMALTSTIAIIATGRYELAIMLPDDDDDALHLVTLSFFITVCISLLTLFLVVSFNHEIAIALGNREISFWLYLTPLSIFLSGCYQSLTYWNNRKKKYTEIAKNGVLKASIMGGTQLSFGLTAKNSSISGGLIIGYVINQLFSVLHFYKTFKPAKVQIVNIFRMAKKYKNFPLLNLWAAVLNSGSRQLPIFLLSSLYSATVVGLFSLAERLLSLPVALIGRSVGQVYFQSINDIKDKPRKVKELTIQLNKKLIYIGLFPVSIILLWGDVIFGFVLGNEWTIAGEYAKYLSIWVFFVFISSPLSTLLVVYEKHIESIYFNLILFIFRFLSIYLGWVLAADAQTVILIYGITSAIAWFGFVVYLLSLANLSLIEIFKQITSLSFILIIMLLVASQV